MWIKTGVAQGNRSIFLENWVFAHIYLPRLQSSLVAHRRRSALSRPVSWRGDLNLGGPVGGLCRSLHKHARNTRNINNYNKFFWHRPCEHLHMTNTKSNLSKVRTFTMTTLIGVTCTLNAGAQAQEATQNLIVQATGGTGVNQVGLPGNFDIGAYLDVDARLYTPGGHGLALRGSGMLGTMNYAFEGRYSYRIGRSHPQDGVSFSTQLDIGAGFGELSRYGDTPEQACSRSSNGTTTDAVCHYRDAAKAVYGIAGVSENLHLGGFTLALELGVRVGAPVNHDIQLRESGGAPTFGFAPTHINMPHSAYTTPTLVNDWFVNPYLGVRLGTTFGI